jgi:hypothetical protein
VLGGEPQRFLDDAMDPAWSADGSAMAYHTSVIPSLSQIAPDVIGSRSSLEPPINIVTI